MSLLDTSSDEALRAELAQVKAKRKAAGVLAPTPPTPTLTSAPSPATSADPTSSTTDALGGGGAANERAPDEREAMRAELRMLRAKRAGVRDTATLTPSAPHSTQPPPLAPASPSPPSPADKALGYFDALSRRGGSPTVPQTVVPTFGGQDPNGMVGRGNIDLRNRPRVVGPDGRVSTVRSISVGTDAGEVLIPTVSEDGRLLTNQEAVDQYRRTGRHLGVFDSPESADEYARTLHLQQDTGNPYRSVPGAEPSLRAPRPRFYLEPHEPGFLADLADSVRVARDMIPKTPAEPQSALGSLGRGIIRGAGGVAEAGGGVLRAAGLEGAGRLVSETAGMQQDMYPRDPNRPISAGLGEAIPGTAAAIAAGPAGPAVFAGMGAGSAYNRTMDTTGDRSSAMGAAAASGLLNLAIAPAQLGAVRGITPALANMLTGRINQAVGRYIAGGAVDLSIGALANVAQGAAENTIDVATGANPDAFQGFDRQAAVQAAVGALLSVYGAHQAGVKAASAKAEVGGRGGTEAETSPAAGQRAAGEPLGPDTRLSTGDRVVAPDGRVHTVGEPVGKGEFIFKPEGEGRARQASPGQLGAKGWRKVVEQPASATEPAPPAVPPQAPTETRHGQEEGRPEGLLTKTDGAGEAPPPPPPVSPTPSPSSAELLGRKVEGPPDRRVGPGAEAPPLPDGGPSEGSVADRAPAVKPQAPAIASPGEAIAAASRRLGVQVRPAKPTRWDHGLAQRLGRVLGLNVRFVDTGGKADGFVHPGDPRSVYLDVRSRAPVVRVFMHEFTHTLRRTDPDLWAQLERTVRTESREGAVDPTTGERSGMRLGGKQAADAALERYRRRGDERTRADLDADPDLAREERAAAAAQDHLPSIRELARLAGKDSNIFRRVYDRLRAFYEEKLGRYRRMDPGTGLKGVEARAMRNAAAEVETTLERLLNAARNRAREARGEIDGTPGRLLLSTRDQDEVHTEIRSLYDKAMERRDRNDSWVDLGAVRPEDAPRLERDGGVKNAAALTHMIDEANLRHVMKRHTDAAVEESRGQLPLTRDDIEALPSVVHGPDTVAQGEPTKAGRPTVVLTKRVNGHYLVVEEVRAGRNRLAVLSVRKMRAPGRATDAPGGAPSSYVRDVSPGARTDSIGEADGRVNPRQGESGPLLSPAEPDRAPRSEDGDRFPNDPVLGRVYGRPDLANPAVDADARNVVTAVDEVRNQDGRPAVKADRDTFAAARKRMGGDHAAETTAILDKVGEGRRLSDEDVLVAKSLVNNAAVKAMQTGRAEDLLAASKIIEAYREDGTEAARAFRQRFDTMMTPEQRNRNYISNIIATPHSSDRIAIDRLTLKIREALAGGKLEEASRLRRRKERILEEHSQEAASISKKLKAKGIDLGKISAEQLQDPATAADVAREVAVAKAGLRDKLYEYWINSILSGPQTHIANILGNAVYGTWEKTIQRAMETAIGKVLGGPDAPKFREFVAAFSQLHTLTARAARDALVSFRTEEPHFDRRLAEARGEGLDEAGGRLERASRAAIGGRTGRGVRVATRALTAADQFFKSLETSIEAQSLGYRKARAEGYTGAEAYRKGRENASFLGDELWRQAEAEGTRLTFQEDTRVSKAVGWLKAEFPNLGWLIPFSKTPYNIFRAFLAKTPLQTPLMAARVAGRAIGKNPEYNRQKFGRDLANTAFAWGISSALWAATDPEDGWITGAETGSGKPGARDLAARSDRPAYSVRIGGRWVSYRRLDPIAGVLGTVADARSAYTRSGGGVAGLESSLAQVMRSVRRQAEDKTFLKGLSDLYKAMENQSGEGVEAAQMVSNFGSSFVPNIIRQPLNAADPYVRDMRPQPNESGSKIPATVLQARRQALPTGAFNETYAAPRKVDLWGRELTKGGSVVERVISPLAVASEDNPPTETDRFLTRYNRMAEASGGNMLPYYPELPRNHFRVWRDGKKVVVRMPERQFQQFLRESGKAALNLTEPLVTSWAENKLEPTDYLASAVRKLISVARKQTAARILGEQEAAVVDE